MSRGTCLVRTRAREAAPIQHRTCATATTIATATPATASTAIGIVTMTVLATATTIVHTFANIAEASAAIQT